MVRLGRSYPASRLVLPNLVPIGFDAAGPGSHAGAASLTWTEVVGASANAAIVGAMGNNAVSGVTFGGVAMSSLGATIVNGCDVSLWGLLKPPQGSQTVVVTYSASSFASAGGVTYSGVNRFGTAVVATGTSTAPTVSLPGLTDPRKRGVCVMGSAYSVTSGQGFSGFSNGTTGTPPAQTRYNQTYTGSVNYPALIGDSPGVPSFSGSLNLSATLPSSSNWSAVAVPLI